MAFSAHRSSIGLIALSFTFKAKKRVRIPLGNESFSSPSGLAIVALPYLTDTIVTNPTGGMSREDRPTLHIAVSFAMAVAVQTAFVALWPRAIGAAPYVVFCVSISAGLWMGRPAAWTSVALLLRAGYVIVTLPFLMFWTLMLAASWFSKNANLILPHIDL